MKKSISPIQIDSFRKQSHNLLKTALIFFILFGLLEVTYNTARDTNFSKFIIEQLTVATSASVLQVLIPGEEIISRNNRILSPSISLSIIIGCEGTEILFLLIAAIIALNVPLKHKIHGIIAGTVLVYILNQIRIVSLFFALKHNKSLFDALHSYIAPILIIFIVGFFFSVWISFISQPLHDSK